MIRGKDEGKEVEFISQDQFCKKKKKNVERDSGANARQQNLNLQTATGLAVLKS